MDKCQKCYKETCGFTSTQIDGIWADVCNACFAEIRDKRELNKDMVNHPPHYTSSKAHCGNCKESIECIEIARHMSFNIGNAVKYLWRHELKGGIEDLKKAKWYINDAIKQLEGKECEK